MERQYWLFNPGPVNTSEGVRKAMLRPDICHREPEFTALQRGVRRKLIQVAGARPDEHKAILVAGSGTAALELGLASIVRPGRRLLTVINGVYGERIDQIARLHGRAPRQVVADWRSPPDLAAIERALTEDPTIDAVAMVHHETTTGLLNPLAAVGALAQRHGKLFFVDAVSSFGGEDLDLAAAGVDFMACTANKCLHGVPGVAFLIMSARGEAHLSEVPARSLYFDLRNYIAHQDRGTIPFTPSIPALYALDQALDELIAEGPETRRATYRRRAALLRKGLGALGLELYLDPALLSSSITAFRLPAGVTYDALHDALKDDGFVIYAGQGKLAPEIFRVANMGEVPMTVYEALVASVRRFLERRTGAPQEPPGPGRAEPCPQGPSGPCPQGPSGRNEVTSARGCSP